MLKAIKNKYQVSELLTNEGVTRKQFEDEYPLFSFVYNLIDKDGGEVFAHGIFQIFTFQKALKWTGLITNNYFTEFRYKLFCFAVTWQGCILAVNDSNDAIYLFDPATCEYFALEDISLKKFLEEEFLRIEEEIVYPEDFRNTMSFLEIRNLDSNQSIAHKISLFLGGKDAFENLEIVDTEVMWDLQIQIAEGIEEMPS